jgi:RNA polymerase sigma-70 factor (ECF subfamily)
VPANAVVAVCDDLQIESWYRDHFVRLTRIAQCILGGTASGEDIAQEAIIRAWRRGNELTDRHTIGAWLNTVTRHLAIDKRRRQRDEVLVGSADDITSDPPGESADDDLVRAALSRINPRQRRVLWQRDAVGVGYAEIAGRLGVTETAARMTVVRARQALRNQLGAMGIAPPARLKQIA